jgi:hypothetical protein
VIWEVVVPGIVMAESVMAESAVPGPHHLEFQCQRARYQVRINWNSNARERDTGVRIARNRNARERDTRSVSPGIPMPESAIPESALPGTAMPGVWMLDTAMPRTLIPGTGPDVGYSRSFIDTIKRQ